jgi:hypothetical protein
MRLTAGWGGRLPSDPRLQPSATAPCPQIILLHYRLQRISRAECCSMMGLEWRILAIDLGHKISSITHLELFIGIVLYYGLSAPFNSCLIINTLTIKSIGLRIAFRI